jgi:hypothetical protein
MIRKIREIQEIPEVPEIQETLEIHAIRGRAVTNGHQATVEISQSFEICGKEDMLEIQGILHISDNPENELRSQLQRQQENPETVEIQGMIGGPEMTGMTWI